MQIFFCMAYVMSGSLPLKMEGLLARPKRFELLTPRFVVWYALIPREGSYVALWCLTENRSPELF